MVVNIGVAGYRLKVAGYRLKVAGWQVGGCWL
jgi:hypothetical protein